MHCKICMIDYDLLAHIPMTLMDCNHTICELCLKQILVRFKNPSCPFDNSNIKAQSKINYALRDEIEQQLTQQNAIPEPLDQQSNGIQIEQQRIIQLLAQTFQSGLNLNGNQNSFQAPIVSEELRACFFFNNGVCKKGKQCNFKHVIDENMQLKQQRQNQVQNKVNCTQFMKGRCKFGAQCKFEHPQQVAPHTQQIKAVSREQKINKMPAQQIKAAALVNECSEEKNKGYCIGKYNGQCKFQH